jgi:hypothetical protein
LSRVRVLFAFLALIALTATLAACGSGGGSDDPQAVIDEATLQGVESGDLDLSVGIDVKGKQGGHVDVSLSGPFNGGNSQTPEVDLVAKASGSVGGEDVDFDAGFTLLGNKAYVAYEGTDYEVDPTTFNFVKSMIKQQGAGEDQSGESEACQEAAADLKIGDFVGDHSDEGSADVGGTNTTKVSGALDVAGVIDAAGELIENPACSEALDSAGTLPSTSELDQAEETVEESLQSADVDLYVGDDHIVRRAVAQLAIEPSGEAGGEAEEVDVDVDMTLTGVNEDQTISAPAKAKPLSDLFLKLGINPLELLGALEGEGAGGLGGLLESLGSSAGSSGDGGGGQQSYYDCLGEAKTPVDIQNCAGKLQ